jgi:hypothetical protein
MELFRNSRTPVENYCNHIFTSVPELAPQRKLTNADDNLDPKNANEEKLMSCLT